MRGWVCGTASDRGPRSWTSRRGLGLHAATLPTSAGSGHVEARRALLQGKWSATSHRREPTNVPHLQPIAVASHPRARRLHRWGLQASLLYSQPTSRVSRTVLCRVLGGLRTRMRPAYALGRQHCVLQPRRRSGELSCSPAVQTSLTHVNCDGLGDLRARRGCPSTGR